MDINTRARLVHFRRRDAIAIAGLITGIFQGKSAVNCIYAVGKQDSLGGKLIVYPAMIEFYAILGFIISIMLVGKF